MRLRLTLRAEADIDAIATYLRDRNPGGARRVEAAFQSSLRLIGAFPHIGEMRRQGVRRFPVPAYPYLIFYGVDAAADWINILTIRHAARQEEA